MAITRAQALLILVGNPRVLCTDHCWGRFLAHCKETKSYCGVDTEKSLSSLIDQLNDCTLSGDENLDVDDEETEGENNSDGGDENEG